MKPRLPSATDLAQRADDQVIAAALKVLEQRQRYHYGSINNPTDAKNYVQLRIGSLEHEVFVVLFLDSQNRLIECEEMFRGTLSQATVFPREVVKAALKHNAAAVMFAHNHPSGFAEPSRADELLTTALKGALALIDVRTLDHFVVAVDKVMSFAERGLL